MKKVLSIILVSLLAGVSLLQAQLAWQCDFEDAYERSQWVLNPCANATREKQLINLWNIGVAGNNTQNGQYGLFISPKDDGQTATYDASADQTTFAVRNSMTLPVGDYDLCFDWRAMGKASGSEALYVFWVPDAYNVALNSAGPGVPSTVVSYQKGDSLTREPVWKSAKVRLRIVQGETQGRLAFLWKSTRGAVFAPSACVDNIMIINHTDCTPPTNLAVEIDGNNVLLSWKASTTADTYEIRAYNATEEKWYYLDDNFAGTQYSAEDMEEGAYVFYVRSRCGEYAFSDFVTVSKFISIAENHCINYLDINDKNCSMGEFTYSWGGYGGYGSSGVTIGNPVYGMIDKGYSNTLSQHTIHYDPMEYDFNTNGLLKTVPKGEIASVRIGEQIEGHAGHYSQVEYDYYVEDATRDLLVLKYAAVLDDGFDSHPDPEDQPRFTIDVYDGPMLDQNKIACACEDFIAHTTTSVNSGWQLVPNSPVGTTFYWKDWTTISLNLRAYIGHTLKIRLRAYACNQTLHFGYAYFTLGCASSEIGGLLCKEPTREFYAPEGFDYRWYYYDENGNEVEAGTSSSFTNKSARDTTTYYVDVKSLIKEGCSYTLHASGMPRYPLSKINYRFVNPGCSNEIEFTGETDVFLINQITGDTTFNAEPAETIYWDLGDGTIVDSYVTSMRHSYPVEGGDFTVMLKTTIDNNTCDSIAYLTLHLPDLNLKTAEDTVIICATNRDGTSNLPYDWHGIPIYEDGQQAYTVLKNQGGCDSIGLNLHFSAIEAELPIVVTDTICSGGVLKVGDMEFTEAGYYEVSVPMKDLPCDTLYQVTLVVDSALLIQVQDTLKICGDDAVLQIPYRVQTGRFDSVVVVFGNQEYGFARGEEIVVPLEEGQTPDWYDGVIHFLTPLCPTDPIPFTVQMAYPSWLIVEKDGFMALLNEGFNGGYKFTDFQWFKNGVPIIGATESYYRATAADDEGSKFEVVVTRESDNKTLPICGIIYKDATDLRQIDGNVMLSPTAAEVGQAIFLSERSDIEVYNVLGQQVARYKGVRQFAAPEERGVYFVKTERGTQKISVR